MRSKSRSWDCYRREGTAGKSTFLGMAESPLRVAIIGAGIGGLSLGLALQERGIQADVYEQAPELAEIGAAIALSANSIREFARLGPGGRAGRQLHGPHRADLPALAGRQPDRGNPVQRGRLVREAVRRARTSASTAPTCRRRSAARSAQSTCTSAAGWSTSSRSATRSCWSSPTAASSAPTSSSGPTACARPCGAGSPAPTTPSTPGPAPSAASCPSRTCPRCPTRTPSSSGWDRTRTCCTTPSAATASR